MHLGILRISFLLLHVIELCHGWYIGLQSGCSGELPDQVELLWITFALKFQRVIQRWVVTGDCAATLLIDSSSQIIVGRLVSSCAVSAISYISIIELLKTSRFNPIIQLWSKKGEFHNWCLWWSWSYGILLLRKRFL